MERVKIFSAATDWDKCIENLVSSDTIKTSRTWFVFNAEQFSKQAIDPAINIEKWNLQLSMKYLFH